MSSTFLLRIARLLIIMFFQITIFNYTHLLGYATPLAIGYMLICFQRNTSRTGILLWGFVTGFLFDSFSNTAGMAAAACTLTAMVQPSLLSMFTPRDAAEDMTPTFQTLGFKNYFFYTLLLISILHSAFYLLDAFTLADWQLTAISIGASSLFTTLIVFCIELFVRPRKQTKYYS
ncbi:MAG: rod shape-determining protein MreD [Bacteroidales bacterium]|nr:rod shape-determining protein MreD [Bacteroidales bacterium]